MLLDLSFNEARTRAALVFSHPKGNIISLELVQQMRAALEDLSRLRTLKLVTVEGAGADFSLGADIAEHVTGVIDRVLTETHELIYDWLEFPAPTAAVVRGRCLGGGFELALSCDFIFAAADATFALPEIALGVFPPAASVLLPKRAGAARAASAILTGQPRSAAAWLTDGLIEAVAPAGDLAGFITRWFDGALAPHSAEALRQALTASRGALAAAVRAELPAVERLYLNELMRTRDANEGIVAFLEKRPPRWQDQ